jgi:hypothetical protein
MKYIFLPEIDFSSLVVCDIYKDWLEKWLFELNENIEKGVISSSECVQGLLCEQILGESNIDWSQVEQSLLRDEDGKPLAYSEGFGRKLYKFDAQWKQMTVYAIYNSFWINKVLNNENLIGYQELIRKLIQPNGWIYNPNVSATQIRTRMKSELLMSLAMGTEILMQDNLEDALKDKFEATLASMPLTGYVSAEYFRMEALKNIQRINYFPEGLSDMLKKCEVGDGYNDFCMSEKTDDYMGTKKRTQHDTSIHTPLISSMAQQLSVIGGDMLVAEINNRMHIYAEHMKKNPMDIPAFKMRDIEYPFGTSLTPLEVISSVIITSRY